MKESDIVTLSDGERYILLNEIDYEGKKYFTAVEVLEDNTFNSENTVFFEHVVEDGEDYLEDVVDEEIINVLLMYNLHEVADAEDPEHFAKLEKFLEENGQISSN